ncbi:glycoside hydrolase family 13 protein [Pengzhenrongella sicca]|uniref:Alpha-glucosidase n=1 Tax=Pengzhenrongella sicca TaxID=2819238 RepID=A0A8A4ZCU3_9MICO|nr:alpha-glucosidase [Pengzhenrongella sicca]QTE28693.1 alpha-glucosidase [Pengzhenrongella sicca]
MSDEPTASAPWWTSAVVYQVYPRSFADSNGDGIGDLRGLQGRLDHLERLGVDVIWLSPVYPSPQDDAGYDISDYRGIDPVFGTLADFDALLADVHARGMKLVMDLVVNHTSDEHPWFVESRSSRDNPKRDWYWWRDARPHLEPGTPGAEPTNWESAFSGPAWHLDPATGQYFLHLFSRKQPDLNWENPQVREAIYAMMRWWLDRGVDGFRMDVINMISKAVALDGSLPDGSVRAGGRFGDGHPHYANGPRIHEFLHEMHREVFAGRGDRLLTVGEMPGATVDDAVAYTDPARGEVDMVFQFEHVGLDQGATKFDVRPLRLTDLKASFGRWQAGLAETGWNSLYWDNHDQPRIVSRFGDDSDAHRELSATMLATVLHLHRGTPYVYQGEELGMTNAHFERIDSYRDIESLNYVAQARADGADEGALLAALRAMSRDNARTPVQWDAGPHAGFTTGTPWIDVNPNHDRINAAAQVADPASVYHHYRRLIELRHTVPAVALGDFTMLAPTDEAVYAFTRRLGDVELLVLGNFTGENQTVDLSDARSWDSAERLIGNYPDFVGPRAAVPDMSAPGPITTQLPPAESAHNAAASIEPGRLRPWESRVYRRA